MRGDINISNATVFQTLEISKLDHCVSLGGSNMQLAGAGVNAVATQEYKLKWDRFLWA